MAQSDRGAITGFIRDQSGANVPNATVTVRNENNGTESKTTTNQDGYYTVTNILPGTYTVTAEASGFKKYESSNNKLDASARIAVDGTLAVGTATETVEVTSTAPMLQSESAATQKTVNRQQIDALELNGRNPIFMAQLVPGTRGSTLARLQSGMSQGPSQINGARTQDSLITMDGAPAVRTRSNGLSIGAADVDSTQEMQILTSSYSAEYGRAAGGQIRIITKSGGTEFHGAAYEYVRNNAFNANQWARNTNATTGYVLPFRYNQYGYNIGGPFYIPGHFNKDKSRFFWYYGNEWLKYRNTDSSVTPGNPGLLTVPTALMRQGNFSELLRSNIFYSTPKQLVFPGTTTPISGNIIPPNLLSPNGLGILKAYPDANTVNPIGGNGNWYATAIHPIDQRKDQLNADMVLTDNQRLSFRRNNYIYDERIPFDNNSDRVPRIFSRPNQTNAINYVWTISPTIVNEAIASVSLDANYIGLDLPNVFNRANAGLNYPYLFPTGKVVPYRIPTVTMSNFSTLNGGPYPSQSSGMIYTAADSITWIKGTHTIKFGGYFERSGENDNDEINVSQVPGGTNNQNGAFTFTDTRLNLYPTTGVAVANAAMGLFDQYSELGQRAYTPFRGSMTEAFVQDSWKATSKLHIDYGVRYSVIVPYSSLWRNMIVFDPSLYDPTKAVKLNPATGLVIPGSGDPYNGMVIPGDGWPDAAKGRVPEASSGAYNYLFRGITNHYSDIQWGQIQPRVGIAYQMTPKTVIRAGGGRFFTRVGVSDSVFLGGNPPFQPTASVNGGNADNPGGTSTNAFPLTVTTQSKTFKNPESWNWNFTVERELPGNSVVSVAYVGRRGLHLQRESDINQPTIAARLANPTAALDAIRPYQGYGSIRETDNVASSLYNSLQISWNRRMSRGFLFGFAYTLSKSMDNGSNQRDVIPNTYDAHNLWAPSEFDNRHTLVANFLYELPIKPNNAFLKAAIGGWQISGVAQFQTGTPCNVLTTANNTGVGLDTNFGCGSVTQGQFPIVNGTPYITGQFASSNADPHYWFNTQNPDGSAIFTNPPAFTFNTSQRVRNMIYQPGFQNWNAGLFKAFPIKERVGLQFRAEAFNVLNHPNWGGESGGGVQLNPTSSTFGKVTSKGSERNMQLSLRLYF
ncbi:MAG: carboxypeptidase regulatory-like domain-containing protein [Bryobacteraceae bacterium]